MVEALIQPRYEILAYVEYAATSSFSVSLSDIPTAFYIAFFILEHF